MSARATHQPVATPVNPILSMLSEDGTAQSVSTMRVCSVLVVCAVLGAWAWVSISRAELQPLSTEQVAMVLGALGIKAWQRGKETTTPESPTP